MPHINLLYKDEAKMNHNSPDNNRFELDTSYMEWLSVLKKRYRQQQVKAAVQVNKAILAFYWELGCDLVAQQPENKYGSSFYKRLSSDLQRELPDAKGFSPTNLKYCRYFYELYSQVGENRQQLVDDLTLEELFSIPWGHHVQIICKCNKSPSKAVFYVRRALKYNWSRSVLMNFLDTNLYEREGKAVSNFKNSLPVPQGDLAQEITRDPYSFNFLTLEEDYHEKELKAALISNITKFLLELGNGFAYMGKEYRLEVGGSDQFLDLLFYNVNLRCYVVIEVKTTDFSPGDLGQLGTYVVAVNHILKSPRDNPTIGLLICKGKNNVLAKYALESSNVPIGVSEYELSQLYPVEFKSTLPSIAEIESELNREDEQPRQ